MLETHQGNPSFSAPWPAVTGFSAMMSAFGDGLQACASAGAAWQREVAKFADRRLAENRRTWAALLSSRDPASLLKAQQQWGVQAATDYTEEATRLARLVTSISLIGTTPDVQDAATLLS
jgi:hypothetical protein